MLIIEISGLDWRGLENARKEKKLPFITNLLEREHYELLPFHAETPFRLMPFAAELHLESGSDQAICSGLPRFASVWKSGALVRTGIELARGSPFVYFRLPIDEDDLQTPPNNHAPDDRQQRTIDRTVESLHSKAQLSATRDYEVWIVSAGVSGFVLLPRNTTIPESNRDALDPASLKQAILHALAINPTARIHEIPRRGFLQDDASSERSTCRLRVLTYNIHSCVGLDGKLAPSRIARIIRSFNPDIVALQEVDFKRSRSRGEDQITRLAGELGMQGAFCCTTDRSWEKYGHALLSCFPVEVIASGLFSGEEHLEEPRGVLLAKIKVTGHELFIANTHFGLRNSQRLAQMRTLLGQEWLGRLPKMAQIVVCGDFNMSLHSSAYQLMVTRLKDAQHISAHSEGCRTFPSPFPISRIDYVFISDDFIVERTVVPKNSETRVASDHLPVIVDLRCPQKDVRDEN